MGLMGHFGGSDVTVPTATMSPVTRSMLPMTSTLTP